MDGLACLSMGIMGLCDQHVSLSDTKWKPPASNGQYVISVWISEPCPISRETSAGILL